MKFKEAFDGELQHWPVVAAVWLIIFLDIGKTKAFGVLFPSLQEEFATDTWIIGAAVSLVGVSGNIIVIFIQPVIKHFSLRVDICFCCFVASLGTLICSVATSANVLALGMFLTGFSVECYILALSSLSSYFSTNYHVAVSVVTCGIPSAVICFAPLTQLLVWIFGWRGTTLLLTAIQVHMIPAAFILRPEEQHHDSSKLDVKEDNSSFCDSIIKVSLLRNPSFIVVAVLNLFVGYGYNGWVVYLYSILLDKGFETQYAATVVLLSGIGNLVATLLLAVLPSGRFFRHLLYGGAIMITAAYGGLNFTSAFVTLSICSCLLGFGKGFMGTMLYIALNASVALEDVNEAMTWVTLIDGLGFYFGGIATGWLFDQTGSYDMSLNVLTLMSSLILVVLGIEDIGRRFAERNQVGYSKVGSNENDVPDGKP